MSPLNKLRVSKKLGLRSVFMLTLVLLFVSQAFAQNSDDTKIQGQWSQSSQHMTIQWTDLIPQDEIDILANPPSYISDIEDGSLEDQIGSQANNSIVLEMEDSYQLALVSTRIKPEMDGRAVRIPGFIVPLEFDGEQIITEFFLVPYFGACLHMPPRAPNQIIHVNYEKGLELEALYDPFWITGILSASLVKNDTATAAYAIKMDSYEAYQQD